MMWMLLSVVACGAPSEAPVHAPDPDDDTQIDDGVDPEPTWEVSADSDLVIYTPDSRLLTVLDLTSRQVRARAQFDGRLGEHPVVRAGRVYVTLRDERALVELVPVEGERGRTLVEARRVEVGPDPRDVLVDDRAERAWVAIAGEDRVVEVDLVAGEVVRGWSVPGGPRWLTDLGDGRVLVASQHGSDVHVIDGETLDAHGLPARSRELEDETVPFFPRVTGRPFVDADDGRLWIPSLYVDTSTNEVVELGDEEQERPNGYVDARPAPVISSASRFTPALVEASPDGLQLADAATHIFAASFGGPPIRGMYTAGVASPDGSHVFLGVEGASAVFVADPLAESDLPVADGFVQHHATAARAPAGPNALWLAGDRVWTYGFLDRTAAVYDRHDVVQRTELASPLERIELSPTILGPGVELGRELFYSSIDERMVRPGGGLSCATCHVDGGTDGLTWQLEDGPRQTPSLAGVKSEQAPVTWTRSMESVADEVLHTSRHRMGGDSPTRDAAEAAAVYIDSEPVPDTLPLGADPDAIDRGDALFHGKAACSTCHSGEHFTDRREYAMLGEEAVRTPTLRGIAATAPYYHDGSSPTLRDAIDRAEEVGMIGVGHLSNAEKSDLVAYLRSL